MISIKEKKNEKKITCWNVNKIESLSIHFHGRSPQLKNKKNKKKNNSNNNRTKKRKRKNNSNNNRTQMWMNSIGSHDDPRCLHGTWTDWHALHDIRQGTYERWKIPGLVWENLPSCNQQSADKSKTWERWVLLNYFPSIVNQQKHPAIPNLQ